MILTKNQKIPKDQLLFIITHNSCASRYACECLCITCELDIDKFDISLGDKQTQKRQKAIEIYIAEYGQEDLFEELL